jgi:hypothetical protein
MINYEKRKGEELEGEIYLISLILTPLFLNGVGKNSAFGISNCLCNELTAIPFGEVFHKPRKMTFPNSAKNGPIEMGRISL